MRVLFSAHAQLTFKFFKLSLNLGAVDLGGVAGALGQDHHPVERDLGVALPYADDAVYLAHGGIGHAHVAGI